MKNIPNTDILFIICAGIVFLLIHQFGYSELLQKFSFLLVLIAYFVGKYLGIRKKNNQIKV